MSGWARRVFGKLEALVDNPVIHQVKEQDMVTVFSAMKEVACDELKRLK